MVKKKKKKVEIVGKSKFFKLSGEEGDAICTSDEYTEYPEYPDPDEECPLNSDEVIFIPGDYCGKKLDALGELKLNI